MMLRATLAFALALGAAGLPDIADAKSKGCPPGLAKKDNGCQPPGQAGKGWDGNGDQGAWQREHDDTIVYVLRPGDRYDRYPHERLYEEWRYNLPPLRPGERYEVINGQIVRVDENTATIMALIGLARDLLN